MRSNAHFYRNWEGAIAFAEGVRDTSNSRFEDNSIDLFCEDLLIQHGRTDEAYSAMKRIGELTMQVELLEAKTETFGPLGRRKVWIAGYVREDQSRHLPCASPDYSRRGVKKLVSVD